METINDEELWVSDEKHICLIGRRVLDNSKGINSDVQVQIIHQNITSIDEVIELQIGQNMSIPVQNVLKVDKHAQQGINDLLNMDDLNDFNSLHGIRVRYFREQIYTQVGQNIIIALNPYQNLPELYSQQTMKHYRDQLRTMPGQNKELQQAKQKEVEPHLYKVAQMAYDQLFDDVAEPQSLKKSVHGFRQDQVRICSMIISGESGSGKTESTKKILKFIAQDQSYKYL